MHLMGCNERVDGHVGEEVPREHDDRAGAIVDVAGDRTEGVCGPAVL